VEDRKEVIDLSERYEESWIQWLNEFDQKVWPMFKRHGYTKDAAVIMWRLQSIYDKVDEIVTPPADPF
jgi:hypothetical protein